MSVSYSSTCPYEGMEGSGGKIPLIRNSQFITSTQGTRPFSAEVKNKWSNVSANPQAFVLCIGANVTSGLLIRHVSSATVSVYIHLLCLYRTQLYSRKVTDSKLGPETGHSDSCLLWIFHKNVGTVSLIRPRPLP